MEQKHRLFDGTRMIPFEECQDISPAKVKELGYIWLPSTTHTDIEGNEIYLGDILTNGLWDCIVVWGMDIDENDQFKTCGFAIKMLEGTNMMMHYVMCPFVPMNPRIVSAMRIKGNIYES